MSHVYEQKLSKSTWLPERLEFIPPQHTYYLIERCVVINHPGLYLLSLGQKFPFVMSDFLY